MAKKSRNNRSGYKNKAKTAKSGKGKQGAKRRNNGQKRKTTAPKKQQPINIYIVNEKEKGGKREDKRVEEREEQATPSKSWLDYLRDWRDARLEKKQEKEQKKLVKKLKASTKKTKKGSPIVSVHKPAAKNAGGVKHRSTSGGSIFRALKTPLIVVLCIALVATVVYLIGSKTGNKEGDLPWNIHEHYDKDGDHWCDKKGCGVCIPVDENDDGICDICNACIHIDEDGNCVCDRCDDEYHEDKNRDNDCDNCGKEHLEPTNMELAGKAVGEFFRDVTQGVFDAIRAGWDWTKDTFKDIGERIASVMPDWMLKERSDNGCEHIDENGNGVCDECLRRFREKEDTSCEHVDADNSGRCDICDAVITGTEVKPGDGTCEHIDENDDGRCDLCDKKVAEGEPDEPQEPSDSETPDEPETPTVVYTVTFDANGGTLSTGDTTRTTGADGTLSSMPGAYLDGYEFIGWYTAQENGTEITLQTVFTSDTIVYAQWTEEETPCEHIDEDRDEHCDICGVKYYCIHIDEDGDEECDKCGFDVPCEHVDEDEDYICDNCDKAMPEEETCEHIDEDEDGKCDECGEDIPEEPDHECLDENEDKFCDVCGAVMQGGGECEHQDTDGDGLCDECGEGIEGGSEEPTPEPEECEHRDANDDGLCDKCGEVHDDGCEHRDYNDDLLCDKCGEAHDDGCKHRDKDDNGYCDKCGDPYSDWCETHRDRNDDGLCDKCGGSYEDGCDVHRDGNDDGYCDVCDIEYDDGEEECEHRDGNDDGLCDYCGEAHTDEIEDTVSEISNLSTLYDESGLLETDRENFTYLYKWGVDGQTLDTTNLLGYDLELRTNGDFKIAFLFENAYFRDYFLQDGAPAHFYFMLDESGKYFCVDFHFEYVELNCLYDIADIGIRTALFDKSSTDKYSKIRHTELYTEKLPLWGSVEVTDEEFDEVIHGGNFSIPVSFLTESNNSIIITVKAEPRYKMSELMDKSSGSVSGLKYEGETTPFRPLDFCGFTQDGKMRVYMHTKFDYIMTMIEFGGEIVYEYDEQYPFGKVISIDIPNEEDLRDLSLYLTADWVEYRVNYGPVHIDENAQVEDIAYVYVRYNLNGFEIDLHYVTVHVPVLDENGEYIWDENGWYERKCTSLFDFYFDLPEDAAGGNITVWNESSSTSEDYAELMLDIVTCADNWGYIVYDYNEAKNITVEIEILTDIIQIGLNNE